MSGWTKDHKPQVANHHCKRLKSDDSNNKVRFWILVPGAGCWMK